MSIDSVTAGLLLQAVKNGNSSDQVYQLYKEIQGERDAPAPEVVELVESWKGKKCKIKHTSHIGEVVGPNTSEHGFYPGGRFPVYVKILESGMESAVGQKFEYGLEQVELVPEEGKNENL